MAARELFASGFPKPELLSSVRGYVGIVPALPVIPDDSYKTSYPELFAKELVLQMISYRLHL